MPDIFAMLGSAVLLGCSVQSVRELFGAHRLKWLPAASMLLCLTPASDLSLGLWIHSFTGFLSLPLLTLLTWYSLSPLIHVSIASNAQYQRTCRSFWWLMVVVACLYYPTSLGLGSFDPHSLGWQPVFVWIPIAISVILLSLGEYWLTGIIVASMLAWQFRLLGLSNGWSYLFDPVAVGLSSGALIVTKLRSRQNGQRATSDSGLHSARSKTSNVSQAA